jgi:predicted nucleotidyltransferase
MKREEVLSILGARQAELHEQYRVRSLSIFGSVARDETRPGSDVDLLVEFDRPVGLFAFIGLQQFLESLLGCKVGLGTLRSLKPRLKETVLREAIRVS